MYSNCDYKNFKIVPSNSKTIIFKKLSNVHCIVKNKEKILFNNKFLCSLYRTISSLEFITKKDLERNDFDFNLKIIDIPLDSDLTEKQLLNLGTALIGHIPDIFS